MSKNKKVIFVVGIILVACIFGMGFFIYANQTAPDPNTDETYSGTIDSPEFSRQVRSIVSDSVKDQSLYLTKADVDDITKDLMKQLNQKNMLSGLNANQISLIEDMVSREVSASLQESNTAVNIDALQEQLKMAEQNLQRAQNNGNSNQSDIESTKKALADTKDLLTEANKDLNKAIQESDDETAKKLEEARRALEKADKDNLESVTTALNDANAALNKAIQESDEKNAKDLENSKKELKEEIAKNLADAMEKDNDILKKLAENTAQIQNTINQNEANRDTKDAGQDTNITNITNMLGGHSIVTVTQSQYNSMTRDPNTIYFITN